MFKKLFGWLQGRSTGFFLAFFAIGNVLHFLHRLDTTYVAWMSSFLTFVVGHSVKESLIDDKNIQKGSGDQGLVVDDPDAGANNT
jgi:hypothetical protein